MTPEEKELVQRIEAAFKDVVRPVERHMLYSDKPQGDEPLEILEQMKNMDWRDVPKNILDVRFHGLSFYSVEAFWYFLPGFMIACIRDPIKADILQDGLEHRLKSPDPGSDLYEYRSDNLERLKALLTRAQREAVRDYIEWSIMRYIDDLLEEDQQEYLAIIEAWKKIASEALPDEA